MEECFYIKDSNLISMGREQIMRNLKLVLRMNSNKEYQFVFVNQEKQIIG